jgi:lipid-binding SYLF domain-containing protein
MRRVKLLAVLALYLFAAGCATVPQRQESKAVLSAQVQEAVARFKERDPGIERFFESAYGYAVLPKVFKGALWIGGAYGKGHVFENNRMVGYCSMSQATLGFSFGGEFFREIIFFRDKWDLDRFRSEQFTFSAQVSGVALTAGAAAKAD